MAPPPWSDLPSELLGLVIDRLLSPSPSAVAGLWRRFLRLLTLLPFAASARRAHFRELCRSEHSPSLGRARLRAVCRSWKSAATLHASSAALPRQAPWIVMSDGSFLTLNDVKPSYRLPSFPNNARCIGSTDEWLALDITGADNGLHSYALHNPFSGTTVPLRELDAVIGDVSRLFQVRKVLMRSTPDDVVALVTNNWNYPVILVRPGKGVWLPKPRTAPYVYIIDVAFLGDKLYGITQAEDLMSLRVGFDGDGMPEVTGIDRVIRHPPMDYKFYGWRSDDDEDESKGECNDDDEEEEEEEDVYIVSHMDDEKRALYELMKSTGDDMIREPLQYWFDDEVPEPSLITVSWHLVESNGKLLMVRRQLQFPADIIQFTRKVEVFEADVCAGTWKPVTGGIGGRTLFISRRFSKSVLAHKEEEIDAIHFIDTGDVYNMRTHAMRSSLRAIDHLYSTWTFSLEIVA